MTKKHTRARQESIGCWLHNRGCRESFTGEPGEHVESVMERAGKAGWVIGHFDGQAHYACPYDAESLYDPIPLRSLWG